MMNNDLNRPSQDLSPVKQQPADQASAKQPAGQRFLKKAWYLISHNWGWKLTSLVLAICLWGGLISQDTSLPRDKVIDGVRITVANANTLRSNGLMVVDGLDELETVRIRARVPQRYYSTVTPANYSVRLDLSQIQTTGEQTLRLTAAATNSTLYGSVIEIFTPEVTLNVVEYATQSRVPVEVRTVGQVPEGYYALSPSFSTPFVDIGGPRDIVERAVRCVVEYDQSTLSPQRNPNSANLAFFFEDAAGTVLDGSDLTVTVSGQSTVLQKIAVTQYAYYEAQVPVDTEHLLKGEPAEGYRVADMQVNPQVVTIAGREAAIAPYLQEGACLYPYEQIDITNRRLSISTFLTLRTPGSMEYVSSSVVQVTVTLEPIAQEQTAETKQ